jgi:hypothetical protein
MKKIASFLSFILLAFVGLFAAEKQQKPLLLDVISSEVLEAIKSSSEIPGLKSEEFSALKNEIVKTWTNLYRDGVTEVSGTDQDVRPYFVAIQGVVEHVLASQLQKNVKSLRGVIHTPMPATPLCSKGEISKELVDSSIEKDPLRLFTVKARTTIVRDYLFKGGSLYVVYPQSGYDKRTEEQQKIYKQELINYPGHLFDLPLKTESIPNALIGATYLFQDELGNRFVFAIKMTQAKDPQDLGNFGLWFGPMHHPAIQERLKAVSHFLEKNDVRIFSQ